MCLNELVKYLKYALNLPWTAIALLLAVLSLPQSLQARDDALIINVASFWWHPLRGIRAITLGNIILLGQHLHKHDLEHELVHTDQHMREPSIHPFLALKELVQHGSENSKYEQEAYRKASNKFKQP